MPKALLAALLAAAANPIEGHIPPYKPEKGIPVPGTMKCDNLKEKFDLKRENHWKGGQDIKDVIQLRAFQGARGIECGGPSKTFRTHGIYAMMDTLDNILYDNETLWEGKVAENFKWSEGKPLGRQYINEGTDLKDVPSNYYDFVLSSHNIEHTANPIRMTAEFRRVLKPGGLLVVILPHKEATFDIKRDYSTIEQFVHHYNANTDETYVPKLEEIIEKHDYVRDVGIDKGHRRDGKPVSISKRKKIFIERSKNNFVNRAIHQNVFSFAEYQKLLQCLSMEPLGVKWERPGVTRAGINMWFVAVKLDLSRNYPRKVGLSV